VPKKGKEVYLPEQETPPLPTDDPVQAHWTELGSTLSSWCSEITGSSSATVYAPPGNYTASGSANCTIPNTVNHLELYQSQINNFAFTFTVAGNSTTPLVIDGCTFNGCTVNHTGTRTVVLTDTEALYNASMGAGNVFFEDFVGGNATITFQLNQSIWARQFNLEVPNANKFMCNNCTLWILGYKTENAITSQY